MNQKKVKVKGEGEERTAKPKMTAEQKACLAACKSLDADVERAKEITACSDYVLHELCKSCKNVKACKKLKGLPMINCRMSAIQSVAVGMIHEGGAKCRVVLERGTCTLRDGALEVKGGAK